MIKKFTLLLCTLFMFGSDMMLKAACCSTSCSSTTQNGQTASCSSCGTSCPCPDSGKTYFNVRPLYQSQRAEYVNGFRNDRMVASDGDCSWHDGFEATVFGSQSTKGNNLAAYFLPFCKKTLAVTEDLDAVGSRTSSDLLSQHFNIVTVNGVSGTGTPFESTVSFNAKRSEVGLGLHWKNGFLFNCDQTKWWYLDISFPITHVKNSMNICENVISTGGGADTSASPSAVANMTQAFSQTAWCFGKINNCCKLQKTGVADVEFKVGRQWAWHEDYNLSSYIGALIPTGNKPKARYVFEPIVGHGGSTGIMWGGEAGVKLWSNCDDNHHLRLWFDAHAMYLLSVTQVRSFDLKDSPWSRYQEVYASLAQAQAAALLALTNSTQAIYLSTPGINIFTQKVIVTPGFQTNGTLALEYTSDCGFQSEIGYNFFARHAECVKLACNWQKGPALKSIGGSGYTNPVRTITPSTDLNLAQQNNPVATYNSVLIEASDLDLNSAAHPYFFSHTVHGAVGYRWDELCVPLELNAGASYEFSGKEYAVLNRWVAWGKIGIAF